MGLLPAVADDASYARIWAEESPWQAAVATLSARHGLSGTPERYRSGTAVVYRLGETVLKLIPPLAAGDSDMETEVLKRLAQVDAVPSPRVLAQGREGEWTYVVMSRLPGVPIDGLWPALSAAERSTLAKAIGAMTRALHAVPCEGLPRLDDDWPAFRAMSRERVLRRNLERGFPQERAGELEALMIELDREPEVDDALVLVHTELGPGHLLVDHDKLSGVFDFAEARAALPEYDFAAVGIFVTRGDRAAFSAFLDGYGLPQARRGPPLVRRLMRHALLHQYGHLSFYLRASPVPEPRDLHAAAEHWFGH